jgi:hypothetical protein
MPTPISQSLHESVAKQIKMVHTKRDGERKRKRKRKRKIKRLAHKRGGI